MDPPAGSSEGRSSRNSTLALGTWSFRVGARSISTDGVILGGEREPSRDHSGASVTRGGPVQRTWLGQNVASFGGGEQVDGDGSVTSGIMVLSCLLGIVKEDLRYT